MTDVINEKPRRTKKPRSTEESIVNQIVLEYWLQTFVMQEKF